MPKFKKPPPLNITTETIINGKLKVVRIVDKVKPVFDISRDAIQFKPKKKKR